jgi:hypothetical protein
MTTALFWVSLALSAGSFAIFALLVYLAARPAPAPTGRNPADMEPHKGPMTPKEVTEMAASFSKAGPAATAATLSVFFMSVALVVSGVVKITLATAP